MPYPESFIGPMRKELADLGVRELRTPADVDTLVRETPGTVMVVVNSMCGCAAGKARPGIALALRHAVTPAVVGTVFAGGDIEATERARSYFAPYPPSSPSIAILRDGRLLYMMERRQIENQTAENIADTLTEAFDRFCTPAVQSPPARPAFARSLSGRCRESRRTKTATGAEPGRPIR